MKYPAKLIITYYAGGAQNSHFETVEAAKSVLDDFAAALAKIKEYGNRDEDPVFRYTGAGAFYAVDLRKVNGASVEIREEWADVAAENHIHSLQQHRDVKTMADKRGLLAEFKLLSEPTPSPEAQVA